MISLGFYGLKNESIIEPLKDKMKDLLNFKHQEVTFSIRLRNKNKTVELLCEKTNPRSKQIDHYEIKEGKQIPISLEVFNRKYRLFYEIPNEPIKKLYKLTSEVRNQQNEYARKLIRLRAYINKNLEEIYEYEKKEKNRIQIQELLKEKTNLTEKIPDLKKDLNLLEKTVYCKYYHHYKSKFESIEKELKQKEKNITKKSQKISHDKDSVTGIIQQLRRKLFDLIKLQEDVLPLLKTILPKEKIPILEILEEIDFHSTIKNEKFPEELNYCINQFLNQLIKQENDTENDITFQEIKMYEDLVNVLRNYKNYNIKIPLINESINDFIEVLSEKIKERLNVINKFKNIQNARKMLESIQEEKIKLEKTVLKELIKLKENIKDTTEERKEQIKELEKNEDLKEKKIKQGKYKKKFDIYDKKYKAIGSPTGKEIGVIGEGKLKKFSAFNEDQLLEYINIEQKKIFDDQKKITRIETHIELLEKEIDKIIQRKKNKYQERKNELEKLNNIVEVLEKKIGRIFPSYLRAIEDKRKIEKISEEQEKYNMSIFRYLGRLMNKVIHEEKEYSVDSIDLIKGIIFTKDKTQIWLSDMGTGQSQSAYLKSVLSKSEDKVIIALFDEISSMDKSSLNPIRETMNRLYEKNRLLAGILVQKGNEGVKIENWVK